MLKFGFGQISEIMDISADSNSNVFACFPFRQRRQACKKGMTAA
jgi:hypothetical protein